MFAFSLSVFIPILIFVLFTVSVDIDKTFRSSVFLHENSWPFFIQKVVADAMVAFSKISMFLGGACALQSQTKDQLAAAKGIIGKKEVAKFGAGMAAFAGIRAGANAIASSTSGLSDSLSESSESSQDAGSRTCHGFIFKRFQTAD